MQLELSAKPFSAIYTSYSISFDGTNFVHLKFTDFLKSDVEEWINFLGGRSQSPIINVQCADNGLDLVAIDRLAPSESWESRLRLHHALGKSFFEKGNPTYPYEAFHFMLMLEQFNLEEFNKAWAAETIEMGQGDLRETLDKSPDHIKIFRLGGTAPYYFRKTPFVFEQIQIALEKRKATEIAAARAKEREEEAKAILRRQAEEAAKREDAAKAQAKKEADELEAKRRLERLLALSHTKPQRAAYTIILSPGVVRYVPVNDFFKVEIEMWIELIKNHSTQPVIKTPRHNSYDFDDVDLEQLDLLFPELSWDERLRLHFKFGKVSAEQGLPTVVYSAFHSGLALLELEMEACLEAWIKEAWENDDVAESYAHSPEHCVVVNNQSIVFAKTTFVSKRLAALEEQAKQEREKAISNRALEEEERLRKSRFDTFIYVMEDLRNGLFKIGRSVTPEKRERTLQSEVPQVQMRFSIPGEEKHERDLHDNFSAKRIRGEWFSLNADDLVRAVSFLKQNGDADRAWLDSEWFGKISFQANPKE